MATASALLLLNPLELVLTRGYIAGNIGMGIIGLLSALCAVLVPRPFAGYAGLVYLLIFPLRRIQAIRMRRKKAVIRAVS